MDLDREAFGEKIITDILVIGGGGAGLSAAVSASEEGAEVVVSEKCNFLGGTTALSIGSITACMTSYQAKKGIVDSHEAFFEDISIFNGELDKYDNKQLCWVLVKESAKTIEWLRSHGFEFFGPSPEPPHRVPRMHNVIPNAWSYPFLLQRAGLKRGVKFLLNHQGKSLIYEDGRVKGAIILNKNLNREIIVYARRAVILACGDFSGSNDLKQRYYSPDFAQIPGYNQECQGDGHIMAMEIGARVVNMEVYERPNIRFISAPKKLWHELLPNHPWLIKLYAAGSKILPEGIFKSLANRILITRGAPNDALYKEGAILVNTLGNRFTNELMDPSIPISKQPEGRAYIVFDNRIAKKFSSWPYFISTAPGIAYAYIQDYERNVPKIVSKGNTIEEAVKNHPSPSQLIKTINRYNKFVRAGKDEDFDRRPLGEGIIEPPFYVMGPAGCYIGVTRGGLDINTKFQVLGHSGEPIAGLFAAGRTGGGLILNGHGLNLSWAFTSGRLAGKEASKHISWF